MDTAAQRQESDPREGDQRADEGLRAGKTTLDRGCKQRHDDNGGVFQKGGGRCGSLFEGKHLADHDSEEGASQQGATEQFLAIDLEKLFVKNQTKDGECKAESDTQKIERVETIQTDFGKKKRGASCNDDSCK